MTRLPDFERDAQAALTAQFAVQVQEWMENFVALVHARLRAYGERNGYDVESTIDSVSDIQTQVEQGRITARVEWGKADQMARWEFGIDSFMMPPVTPTQADVLAFVWEDPPQWVREEFDQARGAGGQFQSGYQVFLPRVGEREHPGIPESRAIRDSLNGLRALLDA